MPGDAIPVTAQISVLRVVPYVCPPILPAKNDFPPVVSCPEAMFPSPPFPRRPPPPPAWAREFPEVPATALPPARPPPPPPPPLDARAVPGADTQLTPDVPTVASAPDDRVPPEPPPPAARMSVCCPDVEKEALAE